MKPVLKYVYIILIVIFLAAAFWAGWFCQEIRFQARLKAGAPAAPGLIIAPEGAALKKTGLLVEQKNHITAEGQADLPVHNLETIRQPAPDQGRASLQAGELPAGTPKPAPQPKLPPPPAPKGQRAFNEREDHSASQRSETGDAVAAGPGDAPPLLSAVTPPPAREFRGLLPGDSLRVPLTGEVKTEVINERTGEKMEEQVHPLSGTALVTAEGDKLKVATEFDDSLRIGVTPPEPAVKRFHLGAALKMDEHQTPGIGGYLQYDIPLYQGRTFDWALPLRVERWPEGWRGFVGVEVRF